MLEVEVSGKRFYCNFKLIHRATIILGDSGKGKTTLVNILVEKPLSYSIKYSEQVEVVKLESYSWDKILYSDTYNSGKRLYLVDDKDFIFTKEFARAYNGIKNSYFLFIVRTAPIIKKYEKWNTIPFSADAVYKFIANGKNHYLEKYLRL